MRVLYNLSNSSMQLRLSANGIDKLIGNVGGITIQLLSVEEKLQNNQSYYTCELNDGFCKVKACVMKNLGDNRKLIEFMVVKVSKSNMQMNKKQKPIVIIDGFQILAEPNIKIGNPISYDEYIKNGKNNSDGDNLVPAQKKPPEKVKIQSKAVREHQERSHSVQQEESKTNDENSRYNKNPTSKNPPKNNPNPNPNTNPNTNTNSRPPPQQRNNSANPQKEESRGVSREQKPKQGPIQRLPPRKQQRPSESMTGRQRKPTSEYTQIRSLYVGMQNWTILGRIISILPLKPFINKKGSQSFLLSFQIGDKSGTIQCSVFGESAQRFQGSLKEEQVYQISNGLVNENSYLGVHKLKVTIMQNSKVNLKEDDPDIPYLQDFCITVKRLTQIPIGEEARVICLVKDDGTVEALTSREGKPLRKKSVLLCDPVDKVEVEIVLWNESVEVQFERYPYLIKGVYVKEYQGNRQYALRTNHKATVLKQHPLRKYIKDLQNIAFMNPDSNRKSNKRPAISNFQELNNAMQEVTPSGTWSQVVCFITAIKHSTKNYYIGCPKCKKKVADVEGANCPFCNHAYQQAQFRYILNLCVADYLDSIWITAYDEAGEALLGISAQQFAALKEEEVQQHMRKIRYKHKKLRLVTKNEDFNGNTRKKTTVIKVIDFNYAEETKNLLERVKHLISK